MFQLPLRQVTGLTQSLLRLAGLDWPAPDYTTLSQRQKSLSVDLGGRPTLSGRCTGVKMIGEGEWKARKHGVSYRRQWRKVHIGIDAESFDIRAIEATGNAVGDGQTQPDLLAQIHEGDTIATVGGDGAYDTRG
ncbi:MAG: transposase [Sphingomonas sp.]|mgnify:CR=1 FL=1|nr:transposase [Sphingomonas sp.]